MLLDVLKFFELILGFSRYSRKYSKFAIFLHSTLFVFLLLAASFSFFLYSNGYPTTSEEVFYVFGSLIVIAIVVVLPFIWGKGMMYTVISLFLYFMINLSLDKYLANDIGQYAAFFLESYVNEQVNIFIAYHGNVIVSVLLAFLVFEFLPQLSCTLIITLNVILLIISAVSVISGIDPDASDYLERPGPVKKYTDKKEDKNFIHIILGEHIGYAYAKEMKKGKEIKEGKEKIVVGNFDRDISFIEDFYRKYKFSFYPHAYTTVSDTAEAISGVMNFDADKAKEHLDEWGAGSIVTADVQDIPFSHNKLFTLFKDNGFELTVYQSKYIDLCHAEGGGAVDKCNTFRAFPGALSDTGIPVLDKAYLVAGHWLSVHGMFDKSSDKLLKLCGPLKDECKKLPFIGYPVNESYPIGQFAILDKLKDDVLKAEGKNVFVASLLLPHHPYVYDSNCKIKENPKDWLSFTKPVTNIGDYKRQVSVEAYIDQLSCVYKRLDNVFEEFVENKVMDKSVVVIHGDHGFMLDFDDVTMEEETIQEKTERKIKDKLSTIMAIYDPSKKTFNVNHDGCDTGTIFKRYIYGKRDEKCKSVKLSDEDDWVKDSMANWFSYSLETESIKALGVNDLIDNAKSVQQKVPEPEMLKTIEKNNAVQQNYAPVDNAPVVEEVNMPEQKNYEKEQETGYSMPFPEKDSAPPVPAGEPVAPPVAAPPPSEAAVGPAIPSIPEE